MFKSFFILRGRLKCYYENFIKIRDFVIFFKKEKLFFKSYKILIKKMKMI